VEEEEDEEAEAEEEEDEGKVQVGAVPRVPGIQPAGVRHLGSSKLVAAWAWKLVIAEPALHSS